MKIIFYSWLISIVLCAALVGVWSFLKNHLLNKSPNTQREFFKNLGWMFNGAGGFGAIAGITALSSSEEILVRFGIALIFIIFGFILVIINLNNE